MSVLPELVSTLAANPYFRCASIITEIDSTHQIINK